MYDFVPPVNRISLFFLEQQSFWRYVATGSFLGILIIVWYVGCYRSLEKVVAYNADRAQERVMQQQITAKTAESKHLESQLQSLKASYYRLIEMPAYQEAIFNLLHKALAYQLKIHTFVNMHTDYPGSKKGLHVVVKGAFEQIQQFLQAFDAYFFAVDHVVLAVEQDSIVANLKMIWKEFGNEG